jgi:hypothetical protein
MGVLLTCSLSEDKFALEIGFSGRVGLVDAFGDCGIASSFSEVSLSEMPCCMNFGYHFWTGLSSESSIGCEPGILTVSLPVFAEVLAVAALVLLLLATCSVELLFLLG